MQKIAKLQKTYDVSHIHKGSNLLFMNYTNVKLQEIPNKLRKKNITEKSKEVMITGKSFPVLTPCRTHLYYEFHIWQWIINNVL